MNESDALLRLALIPGLGPISAYQLLQAVEHPAEIFSLNMSFLQRINGIGSKRARLICDPQGSDLVERERALCHQHNIRIITRGDDDYPTVFKALTDPPLALWIQGQMERRDRLSISVVGPRRPSAYGHRQAQRLSGNLARLGTTIISGLARGIDTIAHEAALAANGRTIAVIGSGLGKLYPEENTTLAQTICDGNGAVLSEFPFHTRPAPGHFPRRNRLVACLSLATLVVEAGERSGALITARLASELGKETLVLPGPVDRPESIGSNKLLRDGATLVTSLEDICEEIEPLATLAEAMPQGESHQSQRVTNLNDRERQVYTLLDDSPRCVDDLVRISSLPASVMSATLISLELRKLAKRAPGGYVRAL